MNDSQQLRESMWDLVYGLVSQQEEQQLIDRIKSDPQAARLYAEVRLEADLVSQAAKVEDTSLVLSRATADRHAQLATPVSLPGKTTGSLAKLARPLLAAAATALLLLLGVGLLWPANRQSQLAENLLAIDVLSDPTRPAGLTRKVELRTYTISADGTFTDSNANVDLRLVSADGRELLTKSVMTDQSGGATLEIPGSLIEPGAQLRVKRAADNALAGQAAASDESTVVANLPVQPEPQVAYFLVSEPMVEEGKPVEVSLWNFAAFSAKPGPADAGKAALAEVQGLRLQESESSATQPGVLNALVEVQQQTAASEKSKEITEDLRREADKSQSGDRVALRAATPLRSRAELTANEPLAGAQLQQNQQLLERNMQRRANTQNRSSRALQQQSNRGANLESQLAPIEVAVPTIPPGQPLKVALPENLVGKEILATAACRGAIVATTVHAPSSPPPSALDRLEKAQSAAPHLVLELPPEADGLIEISFYDRTSQEPVLVEQRQVYRQPLKQLQIEVAKGKERFSPGEQVNLAFRVTDEAGRPAANARLGVRVWNELSVQQSEEPPATLADAVRNGVYASSPDSQQQANQPQSGGYAFQRSGGADAYRQSAQSYGTAPLSDGAPGGERKIVAGKDVQLADQINAPRPELERVDRTRAMSEGQAALPAEQASSADEKLGEPAADSLATGQLVELASNRAIIRQTIDAAAARVERDNRKLRSALGTIVVVGGSLLFVVVSIGAMRHALGASLFVPAGAIGLACLLIGFMWIQPAALPQSAATAVATRTTTESTTESTPPLNEEVLESAATAPPSIASTPAAPADAPAPPPDAAALALEDSKQDQRKGNEPLVTTLATGGAAASPAEPPLPTLARSAGAVGPSQPAQRELSAAGTAGRGAFGAQAAAAPRAKNEQGAPAAIYFNPQLVTDDQGRANIQLVMPSVESEYRVLIYALGKGRVGSQQDQLIIDGPSASKTPAGAK
jgi:hypothetical protein